MGVRQMALPLGTTIAAVIVPSASQSGMTAALTVPLVAAALLAVACALGIVNPPRPVAGLVDLDKSPYRGSTFLWRIHAVSVLLVVPQYTISLFGLVWLTSGLGWQAIAAGVVIGIGQLLGAFGRIGVGVLSDRVGSRVRPLRWVSIAACGVMLALAAAAAGHWTLAPLVFVIASIISVADNGLAYTSVAEVAGSVWAGRALGAQNTGQFLMAAAVGPVVGGLIATAGFPLAFALSALAPALATPMIPRSVAENDRL